MLGEKAFLCHGEVISINLAKPELISPPAGAIFLLLLLLSRRLPRALMPTPSGAGTEDALQSLKNIIFFCTFVPITTLRIPVFVYLLVTGLGMTDTT